MFLLLSLFGVKKERERPAWARHFPSLTWCVVYLSREDIHASLARLALGRGSSGKVRGLEGLCCYRGGGGVRNAFLGSKLGLTRVPGLA